MSVTLTAGITLIDFINKSLETIKLLQKSDPDPSELKLHLATLTHQLSMTMVEAAQLQGLLAQKNEEIRQLEAKVFEKTTIKYNSVTEVYWRDGDDSPFCPVCYENETKLIHLVYEPKYFDYDRPHHKCKVCRKDFFKSTEKRI